MAIKFGTQLFASVNSLEPGQLIEFGYNGTTRWGVVVTPEWKDNCDCYVFDSKEEVPEELLEWAERGSTDGEAYDTFGNQYTFKSFKLDTMTSIQNIKFNTYREEEGEKGEDGLLTGDPLVFDYPSKTITVPDGYALEGEQDGR